MTQSKLGFIPDPITVGFDKLLPSRKAPDGLMSSRKFKQILSSIDAVGLIEPLTIAKADKASGMHLLLDGHSHVNHSWSPAAQESSRLGLMRGSD